MRLTQVLIGWFGSFYQWLTERLYHEFAWAYDAVSWLVSLGRWDAWRKQAIPYLVGSRVLELGFGTGELLIELRRRGFLAVGVEPSVAMQRVTQRKLRRRGFADIPRVRCRAQNLPFASGSFDSVTATFPAGYIFDPDTHREVKRVLRGDGRGRFVIVGMSINLAGRVVRWAGGRRIPGEDVGALWSEHWRVRVIAPENARLCLPVVVLEARRGD